MELDQFVFLIHESSNSTGINSSKLDNYLCHSLHFLCSRHDAEWEGLVADSDGSSTLCLLCIVMLFCTL